MVRRKCHISSGFLATTTHVKGIETDNDAYDVDRCKRMLILEAFCGVQRHEASGLRDRERREGALREIAGEAEAVRNHVKEFLNVLL